MPRRLVKRLVGSEAAPLRQPRFGQCARTWAAARGLGNSRNASYLGLTPGSRPRLHYAAAPRLTTWCLRRAYAPGYIMPPLRGSLPGAHAAGYIMPPLRGWPRSRSGGHFRVNHHSRQMRERHLSAGRSGRVTGIVGSRAEGPDRPPELELTPDERRASQDLRRTGGALRNGRTRSGGAH
jgi:hypothetical protein